MIETKKIALTVRVGTSGRSCSVEVDPSLDTVDQLKDLVSQKEKAGILPGHQRLFYCGVLLEKETKSGEEGKSVVMTLADYGIGAEATVELLPLLPESEFQISVKTVKTDHSSQTVELNVKPTDTVRQVKQMLQDKLGIAHPDHQRLIHTWRGQGYDLQDDQVLSRYPITRNEEALVSVRRLGGLRAIFSDPPGDWVDSKPVSQWSGITMNDAGEVIEISRSILAKHTVADWSKFPSTLQKLDVSFFTGGKVTDDAIKLIATQCTGLQVLDVGNTDGKVTDDAIKLIATQCTGLRELNVNSTGGKVTDDAIKLIATHCTGLQELYVGNTDGKVTDDAIKLVATHCTGLQKLYVSATGGKVTDDAIKLIATQCTGLRELDVFNTSGKVTDASLKLLGAQCQVYE